jgi:Phage P22-like portal protein
MDGRITMEDTLIEKCRAGFKLAQDQERDIRVEAHKDLMYMAGEGQWHPGIKEERVAANRPAMTFSKLHTYGQSVANDARQNKRQIRVNPLGGGATTDTANVINGILRHIQYRSQADTAWDTGLDYAVGGSFGYVRALTEYLPKSMDQELKILTVVDPFSIYGVLLPACRKQVCRRAWVVESITREEYKHLYGGGEDEAPVDFESSEWKNAGDWIDEKSVRIAEYWTSEDCTRTLRLVQGADGSPSPIYTDDKHYSENLSFINGDDGKPVERDEECAEVKVCKVDGTRVLPGTETTWPGDSIPIWAVLGRQLIIDGEVKLFSLIRHVREPQQLINIYKTAIAEKISLGNRIPYIGYKGQFKDVRWTDANVKNYAYIEAEIIQAPNGTVLPLPQRQQLEEQIAALSAAVAQEIDDLKSGMGIFDQTLGEGKNEQSGVGIQKRQQQSNITNFHFADNLNRTEWDCCKALLKVIPKIYDRPGRQVRIVGEDQKHSVAVVNALHVDPESGQTKMYALDVGEYDVVATTGPSNDTARQEGADTLQQFFAAAPQTVPILGDLWVGSLDYPWAREGARRLKAAAPQNIVNDQSQGPSGPQQVQALQQELAKCKQDLETTQAFAQSLHEQIQTKQPELDVKVKIAEMQETTKRVLGLATINSTEAQTVLENELEVVHKKVDHAHELAMQATEQVHQAQQATQAQGAAADAQQSDQQHQAEQATQAQAAAAAEPQGE